MLKTFPFSSPYRFFPKSRLPLLGLLFVVALLLSVPSALAGASNPRVSTGGSSNVNYSSAVVYGYVDARGLPTNYYFQYGTTSAFGAQTILLPAGNGTTTIRLGSSLTGLAPVTVYHYRIVATNASGTAVGRDRVFATGKVPLSVQITGVPNPVSFGSPFFVEGALSGTDAVNHEVVLQANVFPYTGGFVDVGNPELTSSTGGFSFPYVGLLENAQLRVVTVGRPYVSSPVVTEGVAVNVSFDVRKTNRPGYVYLYGDVSPSEVGALVGFQLLRHGAKSLNEGGASVRYGNVSTSRFGQVVHLRRAGLYQALVVVNDGSHVSAYSRTILVR